MMMIEVTTSGGVSTLHPYAGQNRLTVTVSDGKFTATGGNVGGSALASGDTIRVGNLTNGGRLNVHFTGAVA